jgi:hypothetical protein
MATIAASEPHSLIRLHYLWYVAAALAVMVAAIVSKSLWFLNWVHVFAGLLWTGIDLFMGFVLGPILRQVDIKVRREIILRLVPRTLFLMPTLSAGAGLHRNAVAAIRLGRGSARAGRPDGAPGAGLYPADELARVLRAAEAGTGFSQDRRPDEELFSRGRRAGRHADDDHRHHGALRDRHLKPSGAPAL